MVASSSSGSSIARPNTTEYDKTSFLSEPVPCAPAIVDSGGAGFAEESLPSSLRARENGLVVRLFPTPPHIFGIPQTHQLEWENGRQGGSADATEEYELRPLEAEALTLSRMLKSLQPLEVFSGFSTAGIYVEPDSHVSSHARNAKETSQTPGLDFSTASNEPASFRSDTGPQVSVRDRSDSFSSGGFPKIHSPGSKCAKSRRRTYGPTCSSRGSTPSTSIGSASELQFPTFNLRSPPSPEPFGVPRPGSPLKWRSRNSSVLSVEETAPPPQPQAAGVNMDTPVQGLLTSRNPSFSEYNESNMSGKVLFRDVPKKADTIELVEREIPGMDYTVADEYGGPPVDHREVPKVEPLDVRRGGRAVDEPRQSPIRCSPSHGGRASTSSRVKPSVSFVNPFPAWFNSDSRDREKSRCDVSSPPSFASGVVSDPGTRFIPSSLRSRPPPIFPLEHDLQESSRHGTDASPYASEQDRAEAPVSTTSSPEVGVHASARTSAETSDDESDLASKRGSLTVARSFRSYAADSSTVTKSEPMGFWNSLDQASDESSRQAGHRPRSMSLPGIQAIASLGCQAVGSHLTPTANFDSSRLPNTHQRKKGGCYSCHRGHRLTDKEACLVCDSKYCYTCVLTVMESMPEGRKCRTCIGKPVHEAKRPYIGKPSRLLSRLLSPQEVQQIMKAEKECAANQLRPEQLFVNGEQLTPEELALLLKCPNPPQKLKPGRYWYDSQSGLWGKEGERPDKLISPDMKVGGILQENASNGSTHVFMNNRELGKLELKMLKLAGVHCPPSTHLWVEPDGAYQEEGQNNFKGNIWNKTSIRLLYPVFSLPTPGASVRYSPKDAQRDSPGIYSDYALQNKLNKILVLGHEGSGRSTLFKQTKFLFKDGFTHVERLEIKSMLQRHIYKYIGILLEGRERFEEEEDDLELNSRVSNTGKASGEASLAMQNLYALDTRMKQQADYFAEILAEGSLDVHISTSDVPGYLVEELWKNPAIQATYKRKDELTCLPDAAEYFLEKVVKISGNDYEPSDEDILRAEGLAQGSGLAEVEFSLDGKMPSYQDQDAISPGRYQLIKVGGNGMTEGCKWLDMFEEVHAVVFCVAISEYDQVLMDKDGVTYSKLRQKELFESVLKHPFLREKPMVLLLNKYDLFERKITKGIPLTSCEWFSDFSPVGASQMSAQMQAQQGYTYVVHKYKALFASSGHKLFTFKLNAIERDKVLEAFQYVREILNWRDNGWDLFPEESSAYSTDLSSYSHHNLPPSGRDGFLVDRYRRGVES